MLACAIPGVFLVLQRMVRPASGKVVASCHLSYAIVLSVVLSIPFAKFGSTVFIVLAVLVSVASVVFVDWLSNTKLVSIYSAVAMVYPLAISLAVVLGVLLDADFSISTILIGDIVALPFERLAISGEDVGTVASFQLGAVALVNLLLVLIFYRNIKSYLLDENHANTISVNTKFIQYGLIVMISFAAAVTFRAFGAILLLGFLLGPALVAGNISKRIWLVLFLSIVISVIVSFCGYWLAYALDTTIAGSIVSLLLVLYLLSLVIARFVRRKDMQAKDIAFRVNIMLVHLWQHEVFPEADTREDGCGGKSAYFDVATYLNWDMETTQAVIKSAQDGNYLGVDGDGMINMLPAGRAQAKAVLER
jgi:manganese/zinc/iron transport system permease protein